MADTIQEIMTLQPTTYPATTSLVDAARAMRDNDMGDVLVEQDGDVCGIVTDRDIVVRCVAEGMSPAEVRLGDICSRELTTLTPRDSIDDAVQVMRANALRRLPIREDGHVVGIVSLGDLAMDRDPRSVLADISAMPPNN
jgi:CBS domain-containing protein